MSEPVEFVVPGSLFRVDPDMAILWEKTGMLLDIARIDRSMESETVFSVMLSRITREMRREWGPERAKEVLQGFVDTMERSAENDR